MQLSTLSWVPASEPAIHTVSSSTSNDAEGGSYHPDGEAIELHSPRPSKEKRQT